MRGAPAARSVGLPHRFDVRDRTDHRPYLRLHVRLDGQVRPPGGRVQESDGSRAAHPVALGDLVAARLPQRDPATQEAEGVEEPGADVVGLEPAGFINRLRDYAYPMSQRAWATTGPNGAQQAADSRGIRAYIITMPDTNHATNRMQPKMPSHRWT